MNEEEKKLPRNNWDRKIAGPQQPGAAKQVPVFGNSSEPAYSRRSEARLITFCCVVCTKEQTEYRYPGFTPKYCGQGCANQAAAERNERRVAQQREKRQQERAARLHKPNA